MRITRTCAIAFALSLATLSTTHAQSNISANDKFGWAENAGWINWRSVDGSTGAVVHATFLSGFVWGENLGWINLGDGTPGAGDSYGNTDGSDTGVNLDASGDLSGFGWGENIGWINFDTSSLGTDRARFDFAATRFRGYAWGENVGWINLDDPTRFVGMNDGALPDECFLVDTTIDEGVWPFDTTGATTGVEATDASQCDGTSLGAMFQDIWFEYTATVTGDVTIATCGSDFDTDLVIYQGTCGDLTQLACNGDACDTTIGNSFASQIEIPVTAGESYFVRVGGWDGLAFGTGVLTIEPVGTEYVRSDCNGDGGTNIADAITTLDALFSGGMVTCEDACDSNADGGFNIADAIFTLNFLFVSGPEPAAPFPDCGIAELLGCDSFASCP